MAIRNLRQMLALGLGASLAIAGPAIAQCGVPNAGNCCTPSQTPSCSDATCCEAVCAVDPFCCIDSWSQSCAAQALQLCTACDGICGSPNANDCCAPSQTPGCSDASCCEAICAIDPSCCIFGWDIDCANSANLLCTPCGGGGGGACGNPNAGSCCTVGQFPGCSDAACCTTVCAIDPNCCSVNWDLACAHKAAQVCDPALCGGGGTANCGAPNANDCCSPSNTTGCSDATCCETICAADPFCCNTRWDFICAEAAIAGCGPSVCRGVCGQPDANDCCFASQTPGCANAACCEVVCAVDISCCDIAWDASCAANAAKLCGICGGGGVCGAPNANDCCMVSLTPGCADAACCEQVCAVDQFCCNSSWDFACASQALQLCTTCDDLCGAPNGNDCCAPSQTPGCSDAACCEQICAVDPSCCIWAWDEDCANAARTLCEPCVPPACTADVTGDGAVNGNDLAALLVAWGSNGQGEVDTDLNNDGIVDGSDLAAVLVAWGSTCQPLPWATVLEFFPSPAVVTDGALRNAITATGYPWRVRDNATNIEMLLVPPGTFNMGCSASNAWGCSFDENPVHAVTLTNAFYIGRYETTQAQWTAKMGSNPSFFQNASAQVPAAQVPNRPVERVSWFMIQGFLSATGLRLPTEAEWEYACRAGTTTAYHSTQAFPNGTNDDNQVEIFAWFFFNAASQTRPVGGRASNALGLHDMSGNVWEWVNDWYTSNYYASSPSVNPPGPPSGAFRMLRGGSWVVGPAGLRSSDRDFRAPDEPSVSGGFRVARNP